MWPATTWDDSDWDAGTRARGWTVVRRVAEKQLALRRAKSDAQRRLQRDVGVIKMMTAALEEQQFRDELAARWSGSFTLLAFLFAMPDEPTIKMLNHRGDYFDIRSGNTWDLFFPGYYRSTDREFEAHVFDTRPVGDDYTSNWYFNAFDFDLFRRRVEDLSEGRWEYSGGSDLVLVNAYIPEVGEPTVDWESTQSGVIQPPGTLASVIEQITRDLQKGTEDPAYGVGAIAKPGSGTGFGSVDGVARDFTVQALAGLAAAVILKAFGQ